MVFSNILSLVVLILVVRESECFRRSCGYCRDPGMVALGFDFQEFINMRAPETEIDDTLCKEPTVTFCDYACIKMHAKIRGSNKVYKLLDCSENYLAGFEHYNQSTVVRFEGEQADWQVEFCSSSFCFGTSEYSNLSGGAKQYLQSLNEPIPTPQTRASSNNNAAPASAANSLQHPFDSSNVAPAGFSWLQIVLASIISVAVTLMVLLVLGCVSFFVYRYSKFNRYANSPVRVNSQVVPLTSTKSLDSGDLRDSQSSSDSATILHSRYAENYLNV